MYFGALFWLVVQGPLGAQCSETSIFEEFFVRSWKLKAGDPRRPKEQLPAKAHGIPGRVSKKWGYTSALPSDL